MEALKNADILLCEDTRVTKQLLTILKERFDFTPKEHQRFIALHAHNEKSFLQTLQPEFFDANVVYVSDAGMPGISDPGALLVSYAKRHGIAYEVLPGANALLCAYVASGFLDSRFCFYGFLPHKTKERKKELQTILHQSHPIILYEAPHRMLQLLKEIESLDATRELFLAKELTKRYEHFYSGTATKLLQALQTPIKGEWVVVIDACKEAHAAQSAIGVDDIMQLDLPKKQKAKLLSKLTGRSIKELYNEML